ncbi:MAG TPA: hypothetical protein PLV23_02075 [Sedimentibacter sp.]|nr:hypothetical protein [Sedimentibacter sp.]
MKNKLLKNIIIVVAVSTLIAIFVFAKDLLPISGQDNIPIDQSKDDTDRQTDETKDPKTIIEEAAHELMNALKNKDARAIAAYVHPEKGVRFTPYTSVSLENDIILKKEDILTFFEDENLYLWGYYDGSGEEIKLTPAQYYDQFVYSADFINAEEIGYNEVLTSGNAIENQFEVYKDSIIVEYHIPGIDPKFEGLDWQSLRLVFEEYDGSWKLVGIIHNQWTI